MTSNVKLNARLMLENFFFYDSDWMFALFVKLLDIRLLLNSFCSRTNYCTFQSWRPHTGNVFSFLSPIGHMSFRTHKMSWKIIFGVGTLISHLTDKRNDINFTLNVLCRLKNPLRPKCFDSVLCWDDLCACLDLHKKLRSSFSAPSSPQYDFTELPRCEQNNKLPLNGTKHPQKQETRRKRSETPSDLFFKFFSSHPL